MRNFAVLIVFLFSLLGVIDAVTAQADSRVRVEPTIPDAPVLLADDGGGVVLSADDKDKKKKKKKKQDDKDEEDEEDYRAQYRAIGSGDALNLVDPGAIDLAVKKMASVPLYR